MNELAGKMVNRIQIVNNLQKCFGCMVLGQVDKIDEWVDIGKGNIKISGEN